MGVGFGIKVADSEVVISGIPRATLVPVVETKENETKGLENPVSVQGACVYSR